MAPGTTRISKAGQIYDPTTGDPQHGCWPNSIRPQARLPGNCIPIGRISLRGSKDSCFIPRSRGGRSSARTTFVGAGSGPFKSNGFDTRIDYTVSQTLNVFGRFSLSHYTHLGHRPAGCFGRSRQRGNQRRSRACLAVRRLTTTAWRLVSTRPSRNSWLTDFRFGYFKYNPKHQQAGWRHSDDRLRNLRGEHRRPEDRRSGFLPTGKGSTQRLQRSSESMAAPAWWSPASATALALLAATAP